MASAQSGGKAAPAPSPVGMRAGAGAGKKKPAVLSELWNRLMAIPRVVFEVRSFGFESVVREGSLVH